jgi:RNA polymerase sigma-70 factor (ECF subfamily)
MRARSAGAGASAALPRQGRSSRPECADDDVDGAYRALRATVARGLTHRTGCSDLAEDLTQDVFVDLLLAARRRPPVNTRAWLARVAQRHAADTIGAAVRERAVRARVEDAQRAFPAGDPGDHDARIAIDACLARLPPGQRGIVELRLLDGLSFAGCAAQLGLGEDAARMRFRRALGALRRELARDGLERG